ncbi:MAG TPA: V4R domain-containing protein [Longimicrobiales bacterium]|nr:V4R domain-containing protein [Longimicrobiales bacterium]
METRIPKPKEVAIPSAAFQALRRTLLNEAGPLAASRALRSAGYGAGMALFDSFSREAGESPARLDRSTYFDRLGHFLGARGWGDLRHSMPHPAIGLLTSGDWAEAGPAGGEAEPSCVFSSGMLSALLTRTAGAPVAVFQTGCRSRGDDECSFAFGSAEAVDELHRLLEDRDLEAALAEL